MFQLKKRYKRPQPWQFSQDKSIHSKGFEPLEAKKYWAFLHMFAFGLYTIEASGLKDLDAIPQLLAAQRPELRMHDIMRHWKNS